MTATNRHETRILPPKDRSDTNRPFLWAVVLAPTRMNDSEDRRDEKSRVGLVSPDTQDPLRGRNGNPLTNGLARATSC